MADDKELRRALDEIANAIQPALLLTTKLRRDLGDHADDAVRLEGALERAASVLRRLQPRK
jgi:hypothetical protein